MKFRTAILLSLLCSPFAMLPVQAADEAAPTAAENKGKSETPAMTRKERKLECDKLATGKKGIERKKFLRDCVSGKLPEIAAKPAEAAKPAAAAKPAEGAKAADAAKPKAPPKPSHKDAFPSERVNQNPRLLERSCMMDANEQGLTGPARMEYLKNCVSTGVTQPAAYTGK